MDCDILPANRSQLGDHGMAGENKFSPAMRPELAAQEPRFDLEPIVEPMAQTGLQPLQATSRSH